MKIINGTKDVEIRYGDLENSDVFEFADDFYIKTARSGMAVRLDDGVVDSFDESFLVRPVNAVLTVS